MPTTQERAKVKVLVRSRYREVLAKTGSDYSEEKDEKGNPRIVERAYFRQFHEFLAYMTPEEAKNLVESPENQAHIDGGQQPPYFYPAGAAFPVPITDAEPLMPPMTEETLSINDGRQAEAARRKEVEARRVVDEKKKAEAE